MEVPGMKPGAVASGTVAFSWEHGPGVSKQKQSTTAGEAAVPGAGELRAKKKAASEIRVPPPPGAPAVLPQARGRSRSRRGAVRPEDDPFLAAYLACTANGPSAREPKGAHKLLGWAGLGLGLSCKSSRGVVESVVRLDG